MKSVTSFQSRTPSQSLFNIPRAFYTFTFLTTVYNNTQHTVQHPLQSIHSSLLSTTVLPYITIRP